MRVVLDSCILFSALDSRTGASHRILKQLGTKKYKTVLSAPMLFEYEDVLQRAGQFPELGAEDIEAFLDYFVSVSERVKVNFLWRPFLPDPGDDLFLEAAVAGQADVLVSYNTKHFRGIERFGVRLLLPKTFIQEASL